MNKNLVFILGLFSLVEVRILGVISISELFLIVWFILNLLKKQWRIDYVIITIFLWLSGVVIADFLNNTPQTNFLKGFGNVAVLIPVYWCLRSLMPDDLDIENLKKLACVFLIGQALSGFTGSVVSPVNLGENYLSIYGVYVIQPLMIAFAIYYWDRSKFIVYCVLLIFGLLALTISSRNILLIILVSILVYIFRRVKTGIIGLAVFAVIGLFIFQSLYEIVSSSSHASDYTKHKYLTQKSSSKVGILIGRIEFFQCAMAIWENPIIGYGSYAPDDSNVRYRTAEWLGSQKHQKEAANYDVEYINIMPRHSYFLGAWVFSGLLSVPFWLYALRLCSRSLLLLRRFSGNLGIIYYVLTLLWAILFSPFQDRVGLIFFLLIIGEIVKNYEGIIYNHRVN